jgi:hypothetical protein
MELLIFVVVWLCVLVALSAFAWYAWKHPEKFPKIDYSKYLPKRKPREPLRHSYSGQPPPGVPDVLREQARREASTNPASSYFEASEYFKKIPFDIHPAVKAQQDYAQELQRLEWEHKQEELRKQGLTVVPKQRVGRSLSNKEKR